MRRNRCSIKNNNAAVTFENVSQDTATAMHVTTTTKLDNPLLMPLIRSAIPRETRISHAADRPFICSGSTYVKPAA